MQIKLRRNLNSERNKEQEDFFENTMNNDLFFSNEKLISKVDSWSFANVKKLVEAINNTQEINLTFEFKIWNSNVDYLKNNLKQTEIDESLIQLRQEEKQLVSDSNIKQISKLLKENSEDENYKFAFLIAILEKVGKENKSLLNAIEIIDSGLATVDETIRMLMPLL